MEYAVPTGIRPSPYDAPRLDARRVVSWIAIALLHLGFFYALSSGLLHQVAVEIPNVIVAVMVPAAEKSVELPKPLPAPRLPVPPLEQIQPPMPLVEATPTPMLVVPNASPAREASPPPVAAAAPAAPAPVQAAVPKTISEVEYLQPLAPVYPDVSKRKNEEGVVQLRVLVNEQGRAAQVDIVKSSSYQRLDDSARMAVMRAVFKPHLENGRAIPVFVIVPVTFRLS